LKVLVEESIDRELRAFMEIKLEKMKFVVWTSAIQNWET